MDKKYIIEKIKEIKPFLYKEYKVTSIGIFGSYAEETYTDNSDIDIFVEIEKPIGWKFFTLEIFLEQTFGKKIDIVTKNALKQQIKEC